jgi:hypothetical protein
LRTYQLSCLAEPKEIRCVHRSPPLTAASAHRDMGSRRSAPTSRARRPLHGTIPVAGMAARRAPPGGVRMVVAVRASTAKNVSIDGSTAVISIARPSVRAAA